MSFHSWINEKFLEWRGSTRRSVSEFSAYLGVSQPTVSAWLNRTRGQPTSNRIIAALADKLGPEIYSVLGMPEDNATGFREWMDIFLAASDAEREALLRAAREMDVKVRR